MHYDKQLIPTDVAALLGRIALSAVFISAGFAKLTGFAGSVGYATSMGVPFPELAIAIAILVEFVGGLFILGGFMTRLTGVAYVVFILLVNYYFHMDFSDQMQMMGFMKNLAILGGMLMLVGFGPGKYSIDAMMHRPKMDSM